MTKRASAVESLPGETTAAGVRVPPFTLQKLVVARKPILSLSYINPDILEQGRELGVGEPGLECALYATPEDIERLGLVSVIEAGPLWGISLHLHRPLAKGDTQAVVLAYKRTDTEQELPTRVPLEGWPTFYQSAVISFGERVTAR